MAIDWLRRHTYLNVNTYPDARQHVYGEGAWRSAAHQRCDYSAICGLDSRKWVYRHTAAYQDRKDRHQWCLFHNWGLYLSGCIVARLSGGHWWKPRTRARVEQC